MLDAVVDYMPSPLDVPAIKGVFLIQNEEIIREATDEGPFAALAFKIMTDPYVGKLTFFRVYSGTLDSGSYVLNSTKGKRERIGRILQMHANHREEIKVVYSGDIAAAVGLKIRQLVILFVMKRIQLFLNPWNSLIQLLMLLLSQKQKLTKIKWVWLLPSLLKKIQPLKPILTMKPDKQSSLVWVNFTLKSSLTD